MSICEGGRLLKCLFAWHSKTKPRMLHLSWRAVCHVGKTAGSGMAAIFKERGIYRSFNLLLKPDTLSAYALKFTALENSTILSSGTPCTNLTGMI